VFQNGGDISRVAVQAVFICLTLACLLLLVCKQTIPVYNWGISATIVFVWVLLTTDILWSVVHSTNTTLSAQVRREGWMDGCVDGWMDGMVG
jgi:uncharacterized membrane protein YqjE